MVSAKLISMKSPPQNLTNVLNSNFIKAAGPGKIDSRFLKCEQKVFSKTFNIYF